MRIAEGFEKALNELADLLLCENDPPSDLLDKSPVLAELMMKVKAYEKQWAPYVTIDETKYADAVELQSSAREAIANFNVLDVLTTPLTPGQTAAGITKEQQLQQFRTTLVGEKTPESALKNVFIGELQRASLIGS